MKKKFKNTAIALIVLLTINGIYAEKTVNAQEGYKISGTVIGLKSGTLQIKGEDVQINDGKFELVGKVEAPEMAGLKIDDKYYVRFFIANENFKVEIDITTADDRGNISNVKITGSKLNDEYRKVQDHLSGFASTKKLNELFEASKALEKGSEAYKKNYEAMSDARELSRKDRAVYIAAYALNNPNSVVAAYQMRFQANEVDQTFETFEKIVEGFSDDVKKTSFYKPLKDELDALRTVAIGKVAPDFTLMTDKGEEFTLSSLRGKVVLVDFWASWCVPCRKSFPHMKEVYDHYKDMGFEIVGVTNDSNHNAWKKAIEEDGITWIHVADVFPKREDGPPFTARVITSYAAPYLPSTYLLDRDGKVLAKNLHGKELDEKLAALLGE